MRLCSHWEFAQYLVSFRLPSCSAAERDTFLFGSIEPDLNCTTYLKGLTQGNGVHGHNYEQVLPRIDRLLHDLTDKDEVHLLNWYRLGKLTHFIADAFTYPHNSCFPGDLHAHMKYERQLAIRFRWALYDTLSASAETPPSDCDGLFRWIQQQHKQYLLNPMGAENDSRFIVSTVCAAVEALTADVVPISTSAQFSL